MSGKNFSPSEKLREEVSQRYALNIEFCFATVWKFVGDKNMEKDVKAISNI